MGVIESYKVRRSTTLMFKNVVNMQVMCDHLQYEGNLINGSTFTAS